MNRQSTKHGPIIQYAAWKERKLQKVITNYFDYSYEQLWSEWMQLTKPNGKTMRIDSIIINNMKPYAAQRLIQYIDNLQRNYNIYIPVQNFQPSQRSAVNTNTKQREFQPVNIQNNNNNNIKQIMYRERKNEEKTERRRNVDILVRQQSNDQILKRIEKENEELKEEVRLLKQSLQQIKQLQQLQSNQQFQQQQLQSLQQHTHQQFQQLEQLPQQQQQQQQQQELKEEMKEELKLDDESASILQQNVSSNSDDTFTTDTTTLDTVNTGCSGVIDDNISLMTHSINHFYASSICPPYPLYPICPSINTNMAFINNDMVDDTSIVYNEFHPELQI